MLFLAYVCLIWRLPAMVTTSPLWAVYPNASMPLWVKCSPMSYLNLHYHNRSFLLLILSTLEVKNRLMHFSNKLYVLENVLMPCLNLFCLMQHNPVQHFYTGSVFSRVKFSIFTALFWTLSNYLCLCWSLAPNLDPRCCLKSYQWQVKQESYFKYFQGSHL